MYQSQQAITSTTATSHKTATLCYVRPPRDYAVCFEHLRAKDKSRGYQVTGQAQTLDGIAKHHVKFHNVCNLSMRFVSNDRDN